MAAIGTTLPPPPAAPEQRRLQFGDVSCCPILIPPESCRRCDRRHTLPLWRNLCRTTLVRPRAASPAQLPSAASGGDHHFKHGQGRPLLRLLLPFGHGPLPARKTHSPNRCRTVPGGQRTLSLECRPAPWLRSFPRLPCRRRLRPLGEVPIVSPIAISLPFRTAVRQWRLRRWIGAAPWRGTAGRRRLLFPAGRRRADPNASSRPARDRFRTRTRQRRRGGKRRYFRVI